MSHSVEERDVIYYPRESPQISQIVSRVKSKFCSDFLNFCRRTFKSHSGTHGGLLNHVKKKFFHYSNSFIASSPTNMAAPLLFMIFDIFIYLALSNFYKSFIYVVQHTCLSA